MVLSAQEEQEQEKKMAILEQALRLYRGDFLPKLSGEDWVLLEAVRYKHEYEESLQQVLEYKSREQKYDDMLQIAAMASDPYPFDEWQCYKIEALMGMGVTRRRCRSIRILPNCFLRNWGSSRRSGCSNSFAP